MAALLVATSTILAEDAVKTVGPQSSNRPDQTPDWAKTKRPPLWSFAWLSDMHMGQATPEFIAKALHYVNSLNPHFVLITGDNNFVEAPPVDPNTPETLGLRRQRFLKDFLQEHLKTPYVLIPGNNWPEEFDKVFGAKQYSFDCGGLHFMLMDADRAYRGGPGQNIEGFTAMNDATWDWIGRDLDRNRQHPVVVAIHEPVCPLTFLDARRLRNLLDRYPNVFLVLQGHLHVDLEFHRNGVTYLVAPALGKTSARAIKLVNVYPEGLVVRSIPYRKASDQFEMTSRCQVVEIPKKLRGQLTKLSSPSFTKTNYDCVPPHPFVDDPALAARRAELIKNILVPSP